MSQQGDSETDDEMPVSKQQSSLLLERLLEAEGPVISDEKVMKQESHRK